MSTNINSTEQIVEINAGDQITNVNIVSQSTTQVISGEQVVTVDVNAGTIPAAWGSITGTLSNQTDLQNALNAKQNNITLTTTGTTGVATLVGATLNIPNYVSSTKQTEWDSAYNDKINSAEVSGTTTKTLTLTQQDGGIIQASWSDFDTAPVTSVFGRTGDVVAAEGDYNINQLGDVTITSATNGQVLKYNGTAWVNAADASGLTSVGLAMPSAFTVSGSPLTSNGTITVTGAGTTSQYVRGDGSLAAFPSVSNEAKTLIREVYNKTGATLTKGTVIYIDGGQGNLPTVTKAIATGDPTSAQTFGIVQSDITNMNNGFVVVAGGIDNLDTQAYTEGTALYLSPTTAGAWTSTKPYAPDHMVYLGVVVRSHPTQGVIEVKIQNGVELDEIHDVSARFPTNKDGLFYNSTSGVWENKSIAGVLGYTPVPESRIITINGTAQNLSADRTWNVGTVTQIAASGGTGISVSGSPVTGSGTITITNTAPDQVVGLTGAGTTSISGTYPNFTITSNDQYTGTVTSVAASGGTGISISGSPITSSGTINITNTAPDQIVSLTGAGTTSISGTYPNFTVTSNDQYVGTVTSVNATVPTGFEVSGVPITSSGTVDIKFASGYSLPTNAKQGQWDDAYAKRIDSLTVTGSSGSATLTNNVLNVPTYTLTGLGGEPAITAGTTLQYFRGDKTFQTLNTSVVPESGNVYFTEPRVRATVLSGLNITGGSISASDSVLNAFGKVQNQINGLIGGSIFQSTWNASTNTPSLASGVGTKGYYYIVSVAGTTNLDGITDWQIGDWAIFDGTVWRKVDNTDAVVSVNGYTGVVNLVLDDLADVSAASPTDTQLLRYNGTTSKWYNWTPNYEPALTKGNLTEATSSVLTITGGSNAVIGSGTTIEVKSASATQNGVVTTGAQTFAGSKIFNENIKINTDTDPTNLDGKQLVLRGNSVNGGQSVMAFQGFDKTTRWVLNVQPSTDNYTYTLYSNTVTIGDTPSYNAKFALTQAGVLRLHNYTTNGLAAFTGSDGTISSVARTINGTTFDGSSNITITANTTNAITFDNSGSGAASGTTFNGGTARTISYNTIGAQAALTNPVTGTGTQHYLTKFTATGSAIGDSTITNNGRLTAFESNQNNGTEFKIKNTTAGTVAQPYITLEGESGSRFFNFGKLSSGWVADARFSAGDSYIYSGTANLVIYNESAQIRMMSDGVTSQHFRISSSIPISVGNDTTSGGRIEFYRNSTPTQAGSIGNGFSGTISDDTVIATYNATSNWRRRVTIFNRTTASTRVSIGGTNSDFGLSIEGSAIGDAAIALNNTSADGAKWNIYSTGTGFSQGNKKLLFYRDGVDADGGTAVLDWDGRFGLGMVSPSHMIDVLKTQNADSVIRIRNANAGTSASAQFFASNDTNQTQFFHTGTGWTSGAGVTAPASMGGIYSSGTGIALSAVSASGYIVFGTGTSQTERARINSAGLTVKSNDATNSIRLGSIAASPEYNCVSLNGSIAEGQYIGIAGGGGTDTSLYFQTGNGGSHIFRTGNGTSYVTRAFIQNGGGLKYLSSSNPTSGNGMELWFNGTSLIGSYDRDASVYRNMQLYAANIIFEISGTEAGRFNSSRNFVAGPDGAGTTARLTSYLGSTALVANTSNDGLRLQVESYNDGSRNTIAWGQNGSNLTLGRFGIAWNNSTTQMCFVWRDMYNGAAGSTEIMRLTGGGRLGIGVDPTAKLEVKYDGANGNAGAYGDYNILATSATTSQSYQATIGAIHTGGGYANLNLGDTDSGTTRFWHISKRLSSSNDQGAGARSLTYYWNNGSGFTAVFSFSTGGNLYAAGGYFESSDIRLKTVIERNPLIDLNVDVIKFTKHGQEGIRYGYSAQEVQAIAPELVTDGEYLQLNYTDVHTLKIAKLEAEVKSLKEQLKNK